MKTSGKETREPRLSLCVIARNEAANIERCLASARDVADEIVVLDTGSEDETPAIAREMGAQVHVWAWRDDFGAALNEAFRHVSGDWILRLDCDEELLPESRPLVRELIRREDALGFHVFHQEVEHEGQTGGFVEMRHLRLTRRDPSLPYVGRCHPHFPSLRERCRETGRGVFDSEVRVRHRGYQPHLIPGKLERAARILQLELEERPGQLYYEIELGRTWVLLGDPRGAELLGAAMDRVLEEALHPAPPSLLVAPLLEWCLLNGDPGCERTRAALRLAERWFPKSPPLLLAAAEIWFRREEFDRAVPYYERLARCGETGDYDRSTAFPAGLLADGPLLYLAVCHHHLGRLDRAEQEYRRLLERFPEHPAAIQNLAVLARQRLAVEALPTLQVDQKTAKGRLQRRKTRRR